MAPLMGSVPPLVCSPARARLSIWRSPTFCVAVFVFMRRILYSCAAFHVHAQFSGYSRSHSGRQSRITGMVRGGWAAESTCDHSNGAKPRCATSTILFTLLAQATQGGGSMTRIAILGQQPQIRAELRATLQQGIADAVIQDHDLEGLQRILVTQPLSLLIVVVEFDENPEYLVTVACNTYQPEHIQLNADEPILIDHTLCFKQPLIKGITQKGQERALFLASVQVILLGGQCFPPYDRRMSKRRAVLSVYQSQVSTAQAPAQAVISSQSRAQQEAALLGLTERQYEVLVLLAQSDTLKTIAQKMDISTATAKTHTEALYQRLGANSRSSAVFNAMERGAKLGITDKK